MVQPVNQPTITQLSTFTVRGGQLIAAQHLQYFTSLPVCTVLVTHHTFQENYLGNCLLDFLTTIINILFSQINKFQDTFNSSPLQMRIERINLLYQDLHFYSIWSKKSTIFHNSNIYNGFFILRLLDFFFGDFEYILRITLKFLLSTALNLQFCCNYGHNTFHKIKQQL